MTLLRHELKRSWKSLLIWTLAIGSMLAIALLIYPEMKKQMESLSAAMSSMGAFSSAFGMDQLNFGDLKGYYAIEIGNTVGLGGALFSALIAVGVLAKEEKNGTAEFLLTHPKRRSGIVTFKLLSVFFQILVLNLVITLMAAASIAVIGEPVPWTELLNLHTAYFLMQLVLAGICFGISAFLRNGSLGIGLGLALGMYFLNIIANLTSGAEFLKYITPFGFADGSDIISRGGIHTGRLLVGLAMAGAGIGIAYWKYTRKDIR